MTQSTYTQAAGSGASSMTSCNSLLPVILMFPLRANMQPVKHFLPGCPRSILWGNLWGKTPWRKCFTGCTQCKKPKLLAPCPIFAPPLFHMTRWNLYDHCCCQRWDHCCFAHTKLPSFWSPTSAWDTSLTQKQGLSIWQQPPARQQQHTIINPKVGSNNGS